MQTRMKRLYLYGTLAGVLYGLVLRVLFGGTHNNLLELMSVGFLFLVPLVLGVLAISFADKPSWKYSIFFPWVPILLFVAMTALFGLEGIICIVMALPLFLIMGSLGGICSKLVMKSRHRMQIFTGFLLLPILTSAVESRMDLPNEIHTVHTEIVINAPQDEVWKNIIRVPAIQPHEHHFSFFHLIGFPKPIEATLSHEGVGGVRHATFEGGVLFVETITKWEEKTNIVFSIKADTETIPATTLDQHVTIGGEYFDMLEGEYRLEPIDDTRIRLHLYSKQRLSTRFNAYTALWTESIMRDIQDYILKVIKRRCETAPLA